jgi:hypothetical protein
LRLIKAGTNMAGQKRRKIGWRREKTHTYTQKKCETDGTRKKSVVIVLITMG